MELQAAQGVPDLYPYSARQCRHIFNTKEGSNSMKEISHICIVGGGSSGWMTALALLNKLDDSIQVSLIESSNIPTIGVGEATVPPVAEFIKEVLELKEEDWMSECDATFKTSIRFNKFNDGKEDDIVYHPFFKEGEKTIDAVHWSIKNTVNYTKDFDRNYIASTMGERNKFSKQGGKIRYAYNLDASKFGQVCKNKCLEEFTNITNIIGNVSEIVRDSKGAITHIEYDDSERIAADLFIDCTGLKYLMSEGAEFVDFSEYLVNNKALAVQVPSEYKKKKEIPMFTDCTATKDGWVWRVPLWSRDGVGFVYSTKFTSDRQAKENLEEYINELYDVPKGSLSFKYVDYKKVRYLMYPWEKNRLSIGMSASFLEPLESTALWITTDQIRGLIGMLRNSNMKPGRAIRSMYNDRFRSQLEDTLSFVQLHYSSGNRSDSKYWSHLSNMDLCPGLLRRLKDAYSNNWQFFDREEYYHAQSWETLILSLEAIPTTGLSELTYRGTPFIELSEDDSNHIKEVAYTVEEAVRELRQEKELEVEGFLNHYDYLKLHIHA